MNGERTAGPAQGRSPVFYALAAVLVAIFAAGPAAAAAPASSPSLSITVSMDQPESHY